MIIPNLPTLPNLIIPIIPIILITPILSQATLFHFEFLIPFWLVLPQCFCPTLRLFCRLLISFFLYLQDNGMLCAGLRCTAGGG